MKKQRPFNPQAEAASYQGRAYWLASLGFASYAEYLASPLWQAARAKAMRRAKGQCCCCGGRASQVHHSRYHKNDLLGKTTKYLHAICGTCHHAAEFQWRTGKKGNVIQANSKLQYMTQKGDDGLGLMERAKATHETLDAEFDAIFA